MEAVVSGPSSQTYVFHLCSGIIYRPWFPGPSILEIIEILEREEKITSWAPNWLNQHCFHILSRKKESKINK